MIRKKLTDLHKRLVVSSIVITILAGLMIFSDHFLVKTILVLCVAAFAGIGVWEYAQFARAKQLRPAVKAMIIIATCEVFAFFAAHKLIVFSQMPAIVLSVGAVVFFLLHFKDIRDALVHVAVEFFGVCYVSVPLSFMLAILYPMSSNGMSWDGRWWLIYLIVVTKITDVAAYFVGRLWGQIKLAPFLSPGKTIEGAVAGFVCAVICSICMSLMGSWIDSPLFHLPMMSAVILGMCIGLAGEVGDLAESLLKRDAVVKDSNNLPGLGGILDMVDSLLLTAPIVYFYLKLQG
ncbi:MAG: CDP-archaeol synthase [Chlamydiota bacterium]